MQLQSGIEGMAFELVQTEDRGVLAIDKYLFEMK